MLGVMAFVIPLGVALSTFGCALSIQFSVTRLCYVAAREGHMLEAFSYIHVRRLTPAPAVVMQVSDTVHNKWVDVRTQRRFQLLTLHSFWTDEWVGVMECQWHRTAELLWQKAVLSQCRVFYRKPYMKAHGIEPGPPRWQAGDWPVTWPWRHKQVFCI